MPLFLRTRDRSATELMDNPGCNPETLYNTYRQFEVINFLLSRWDSIYRRHILPFVRQNDRPVTILDIGFGGGDILHKLDRWAKRDQIELQLTGIETDERALSYVRDLRSSSSIRFIKASSSDLLNEGRKFDFVISNHLLHHLEADACLTLMEDAKQLSRYQVLFNDIERSDMGYILFNFLRPLFSNSFIITDGFTSIRRSFTSHELRELVTEEWQVTRIFPFRLLLKFQHE